MARRIPRPNFHGNRYFWLGIIGGIVIILLLVGSSLFKTAGIGKQSVTAEFEQAAGMRVGDKVRVAGVEVGKVSGAKIDGDHIDATLSVDKKLKFGPDAHAAIKISTILGLHYVELQPGDGSGLPGDRIPLSNTSVPFSLSKVVIDPKFPHQWSRVEDINTEQLAQALNVLNEQFGDSPTMVPQALDSVGALAKVIDKRHDQVQQLLQNLDSVTKVLSDNRNGLMLIINQGGAITKAVQDRGQLVQGLLNNVGTLSRQLKDMGIDNNGQLGPLITQLDTISQGLEKNRDNLNNMLQVLPPTVRQLTNGFGNGPYLDGYLPWLFPDNWLCFANVVKGCQG
ncbi:MCE family protein [Skermania sp. ID1734]|uniref:MCE family protein n=1 Tax=Skermania sp. ID1734 TaxID=2597516 RepID=UPI00117D2FAC|nr:MCE family protein [Skermania sp. ID1734]TSE00301.1 MCE family protein [Skermania sp. ID1734]